MRGTPTRPAKRGVGHGLDENCDAHENLFLCSSMASAHRGCAWKPLDMVIALPSRIHDALPAEEDAIGLNAGQHRTATKVTEFLAVDLAVVNGRLERRDIECGMNGRQAFQHQRRQHHAPGNAIKPELKQGKVHLVVVDALLHQPPKSLRKRHGACQCGCGKLLEGSGVHVYEEVAIQG